jgi:OmpA-OmpF porin, OOP family
MKKTMMTLGMMLAVTVMHAQDGRLSFDAQIGLNNPITPLATGYDTPGLGGFHVGIGGQYMLTEAFGLRLGVSNDWLGERKDHPEFATNYFRTSLEGVIDFGKIVGLESPYGIYLHAGGGYALMTNIGYDANDNMLNFTAGLTPKYILDDNCTVYLDFTAIANLHQSRTFDFTERASQHGFDGYMVNLSLGFQYTLKQERRPFYQSSPE